MARPTSFQYRWRGLLSGFVAGVIGTLIVVGVPERQGQAQDGISKDKLERLQHTLAALENVLVSLAVDTERTAIGVAKINTRLGKIENRLAVTERRLGAIEAMPAD